MQCAQCHSELPENTEICPQCGTRVAAPSTSEPVTEPSKPVVDEASAAAKPEAAQGVETPPHRSAQAEQTAAEPAPQTSHPEPPPDTGPAMPKKRNGHGCLISFGVFLVVVGFAAAVFFDLPMRLGLVTSPAKKMFVNPPDRVANLLLMQEFERSGQPTKGIRFCVLPYKDRGYSLAYVSLDQSKGYRYVDTGFDNPIIAAFMLAARSKAVEEAQINRVSVEFRERDGATLFVVTAPVFAIQQYAAKTITKQQFYAQADGHGNLARIMKDQYTPGDAQ